MPGSAGWDEKGGPVSCNPDRARVQHWPLSQQAWALRPSCSSSLCHQGELPWTGGEGQRGELGPPARWGWREQGRSLRPSGSSGLCGCPSVKGFAGGGRRGRTALGAHCSLSIIAASKEKERADFLFQFLTGLQGSPGSNLPPDAGHVPAAPALSSHSPSAASCSGRRELLHLPGGDPKA